MAMRHGWIVVLAAAVALLGTGADSSPPTTSGSEYGQALTSAIEASGAVTPGTTLRYAEIEPNGGVGGVWPLTETYTVNPDGSLVYRLIARGVLDGRDITLTTDLRCPSGSTWCWKRFPYEFKDAKWHQVRRSLVLYGSARKEALLFAGTRWPDSNTYSMTTSADGSRTFTQLSPQGLKDEWVIRPASITYTDSCIDCGTPGEAISFQITYSSRTTPLSVTAPARRAIGSAGDREGYATMFSIKTNR